MFVPPIDAYGGVPVLAASHQTNVYLPDKVQMILSLFQKMHASWRSYRKVELITRNTNHLVAYLAGSGLAWAVQILPGPLVNSLIAPSALTLAMIQRLLEAANQTQKVAEASSRFYKAYHDEIEAPPKRISLSNRFFEHLFYPDTLQRIQNRCDTLLERTKQVFWALMDTLLQTWKLSMRLMDLKHVLEEDTESHIAESGVNLLSLPPLLNELNHKESYAKWVLAKIEAQSPLQNLAISISRMQKAQAHFQQIVQRIKAFFERVKLACARAFRSLATTFRRQPPPPEEAVPPPLFV